MSDEPPIAFSAVIVTFNSEDEITNCLQSLAREFQSARSEVFVIDNASSDATVVQTQAFQTKQAAQEMHIGLLVNSKNFGFTKALNQGLERCSGNFVLVLNPDVELQAGSLQQLVSGLDEPERIVVTAPQLRNADGTVQPSCRRFPRRRDLIWELTGLSRIFHHSSRFNRWKMGDFDHKTRQLVDQPQGACLLFKRTLLQEIGLWDERFPMFFSDVDWCFRVKSAGYEILFDPAAKAMHLQGVSVFKRRASMIWTSHRSFYHYFKKNTRDFLFVNEILGAILWLVCIVRICTVPLERIIRGKD